MKYIVIEQFKGLPAGTELTESKGKITHDGKFLCFATSQNAHDFLSPNGDGNGVERHQLIEKILKKLNDLSAEYAEAVAQEKEAWEGADDEFVPTAEDKRQIALTHFKAKHLTDGIPNHAFRTASITDLRDLDSEIAEL